MELVINGGTSTPQSSISRCDLNRLNEQFGDTPPIYGNPHLGHLENREPKTRPDVHRGALMLEMVSLTMDLPCTFKARNVLLELLIHRCRNKESS